METKRNLLLIDAMKLALGFGVAITVLSAPARAQDAPTVQEEEAAELERVQVTGTRLQRVDIEGAAPVTTVNRDDLERIGYDSLAQVVQSLPSFTGSPVNTSINNGGAGGSAVDLRGLGSARTLVLINGRRSDAAGDLNSIPVSMVERIEILKDGASAVYGADAVAGVVNIITRKDFEGMEVSVQNLGYTDPGAKTNRIAITTGGSNDRSNYVVGLDYVDQGSIFQGDVSDNEIFQAPWGVLDWDGLVSRGFIPNETVVQLGSSIIPGSYMNVPGIGVVTLDYTINPDGSRTYAPGTSVDDFRPYDGSGPGNDSYNYEPVNYLQTPSKRASFFMQGVYEITDSVVFFAEATFQNRRSEQMLAPLPYGPFAVGDPGAVLADGTLGITAGNYYNVFNVDIHDVRTRMEAAGGRNFHQDVSTYRAVAGLNGVLMDRWDWEVSYNYSRTAEADTDYGQFAGARLANALGDSFEDADGNIVCGTPGNVIEGCVPLNLFGGPDAITQEMLDYVSAVLTDVIETDTQVMFGSIGGDLLDMPAGYLQGAIGFENRRESLVFNPDSGKVFGTVTGNKGEGTRGSKAIDSFFAELNVPVLSDMFLADALEIGFSARRDSYQNFDNTSTQAAVRWKPVDTLLIRATTGESFREPTIGNMFGGQADSFEEVEDPCNTAGFGDLSEEAQGRCIAQGVPNGGWDQTSLPQLRARVGGNPNVQPEKGESFTLGVAWSPEVIEGFALTLDYWSVEVEDKIESPTAALIFDLCIVNGVAEYCDLISRAPDGTVTSITTLTGNFGLMKARGLDVEASYRHEGAAGWWTHRLLLTNLIERSSADGAGFPLEEIAGEFDSTFAPNLSRASFPKQRMTYTLDWGRNSWGASARIEHISSLKNSVQAPANSAPQIVPAITYLDLTGRYAFASDTEIEFGLTNVTDEEAPYIANAFNANTDPALYRVFGAGYFMRLTQSF